MGLLDRNKMAETAESTGGDFKRLEPGNYTCRVQKIVTEWTNARGERKGVRDSQCVMCVLDIDEGEFAGEFSRDWYADADKDKKHAVYMSFSDNALGMLKHSFHAFDEANPGFDSEAAFDAEQWTLFIAKRVRVRFEGREWEWDGRSGVAVEPRAFLTADEDPEPRVQRLDRSFEKWEDYQERTALAAQRAAGASTSAASAAPAAYSEDIPF